MNDPTNTPAPATEPATDGGGLTPPPSNPAPPAAPGADPSAEGSPAQPDVSQQIEALRQELQAARTPQAPPQPEVSLNDLLSYDPQAQQGDPNAQVGDPQNPQVPPNGELAPEQAEAMFNQAIQDRVQDAVYPYLEAVDREMRRGQLEKMTDTYPELKDAEAVRAVRDRLMPIAERYDDPSLLSDPALVEQAVLAERAARTAASETPANEARNQGAVLETGHAAAAGGDDDPVAAFKRDFLQQGAPQDVFTGSGL